MKRANTIIKGIEKSGNFKRAFIHTSFQNEKDLEATESYECLEFLGDSILNFHTSFFIYKNYPNFTEGQMSKLKQYIVKESSLEKVSRELNLSRFLKLSEAERKNGGMEKASILADIYESLIAAIYLEKGEKVVWNFLNNSLFKLVKGKEDLIWDYKTKLQEFCQSKKNSLIYNLIEAKLDFYNNKTFVVKVNDKFGEINEVGIGKTKKSAEQNAAFNAMKTLKLI